MKTLEETVDHNLGVALAKSTDTRVRHELRKQFNYYITRTGTKSVQLMSPFWRGWARTFEPITKADRGFVERMRKEGVFI